MAQPLERAKQGLCGFEVRLLEKEILDQSASGVQHAWGSGAHGNGKGHIVITASEAVDTWASIGGFSADDASLIQPGVPLTELEISFFFQPIVLPTADGDYTFFELYDNTGTRNFRLTINKDGYIKAKDATLTHNIGTAPSEWNQIYLSLSKLGANDQLSVLLNRTIAISNELANYGPNIAWWQIIFGRKSAEADTYGMRYDDLLFVDDTLGITLPTTTEYEIILKECQQDGTHTAWTATAGADYECLDDSPTTGPNDDTDYVWADKNDHDVGDSTTVQFHLTAELNSDDVIHAICHWSRSGFDALLYFWEPGFKQRLRINSIDYDDHEALGIERQGWQTRGDIFWENPDDSQPWEFADLHLNAELGIVVSKESAVSSIKSKYSTAYMMICRDVPEEPGEGIVILRRRREGD